MPKIERIDVGPSSQGGRLGLTVHTAEGGDDGPTVAVLAGVHGDESAGVDYARAIFLAAVPRLLRGRLRVVPVANPVAFARRLRAVDEDTGGYDLNRCFGQDKPTTAGRMADALAREVLDDCDVLVDLHHGAWGEAWGMVGIPDRPASGALAEAFGFPWVKVSQGYTRGSASHYVGDGRGQATLSVCIGGRGFAPEVEAAWRRWHVEGMERVLAHLGMLPEVAQAGEAIHRFERGGSALAQVGGMLVLDRPLMPGDRVEEGERLGAVIDPYDFDLIDEVRSPAAGVCYATSREGPIHAGRFVASVAVGV